LYRPRPFAEEVMALAARAPVPIRIIASLWFIAGGIYLISGPSSDVLPLAVALPITIPFLLGVAALAIFNMYRVICWIAQLMRGE
jgi:hypothetical protein